MDKDDWDEKFPTILWAYKTSYKKETNQTPFKLVYGQEAITPLHFRQHAPEIAHVLKKNITNANNERMFQLQKLEEDRIMAIHH